MEYGEGLAAPRAQRRIGMTEAAWVRVKAIFHDALDVPEPNRAAFVDAAAAGDEAVAAEVASLLRSHASAGAFMEQRATSYFAGGVSAMIEGRRIGSYR